MLRCDSTHSLQGESTQPCLPLEKQVAEQIAEAQVSPAIQPYFPTPSDQQLEWQRDELYLFIHYGINTYTGEEWGDGNASPELFNPSNLDVNQWVRVAKNAGFKGIILTAKHHEGFALWPTSYSDYSIVQSPWENGQGDVVRLLADACRNAGIKFGVYLSPWDRHEPTYGTPAYDDFFVGQLTELLTGYGPVFEVWLDAAREPGITFQYDFDRYFETIRQLQPDALIANLGPDIRWVGNETGQAPERLYSSVSSTRWYPVECDVSMRPHWFWRKHEDKKVMSSTELLELYFSCVGRNGVLLLGTAPNREGVIPEQDVMELARFGERLNRLFEHNLADRNTVKASSKRDGDAWGTENLMDSSSSNFWVAEDGVHTASIEVSLSGCQSFNIIELKEPIQFGQRVDWHRVEVKRGGRWHTIIDGSTIGHKRLHQVPQEWSPEIRITVHSSQASPALEYLGIYFSPALEITEKIKRFHSVQ